MFSLLLYALLFWNQESPQNTDFTLINSGIGQESSFEDQFNKDPVWQNKIIIWFELKYQGEKSLKLKLEDVGVKYEAELANSRIPGPIHCLNRSTKIGFRSYEKGKAIIFESLSEKLKCYELITLFFNHQNLSKQSLSEITLNSNEIFFITLKINHCHFIYGSCDPLLGKRKITLRLGNDILREEFLITELDEKKRIPEVKLSTPSKERLDNSFFKSPPDSLYLCADVGGLQYFRFDDLHLPYNSKWKISFWYLIAYGTEGKCRAKLVEYQDTPDSWWKIDDGGFDEVLEEIGQWHYFEKTFITTNKTTSIAFDFRIVESSIGEMWIDDTKLEPIADKSFKINEKP